MARVSEEFRKKGKKISAELGLSFPQITDKIATEMERIFSEQQFLREIENQRSRRRRRR